LKPHLLLLLAALSLRADPDLKVVHDRDIFALLPGREAVENIDDRLFRSLDGRRLHFGPDPQGRFYEITGKGAFRERQAPSTGKAYLDARGDFVIWYDRLDLGIHFPNHFTLRLENPAETRFGVTYDAVYFHLATPTYSEVFATERPFRPLVRLDGFYLLKAVPHADRLYLFGYERFIGQRVRASLALVFQEINGVWTEMRRHPLPDHLTLLDAHPAADTVLLLDTGPTFPVLYQFHLRTRALTSLGPVDEFGFYLHTSFDSGKDAP
jgi:hypothetical protein